MTFFGWIFMLLSWTVIIGMFVYCMARATRRPNQDDTTQPADSGQ